MKERKKKSIPQPMSLGEWFRFIFSKKEFQKKLDDIILKAFGAK